MDHFEATATTPNEFRNVTTQSNTHPTAATFLAAENIHSTEEMNECLGV